MARLEELVVEIRADLRAFEQGLGQAQRQLRSFGRTTERIGGGDLSLDIQPFTRALDRAQADLRSLNARTPEVTVTADTSQAEAAINEVESELRGLNDVMVDVGGEAGGAGGGLDGLLVPLGGLGRLLPVVGGGLAALGIAEAFQGLRERTSEVNKLATAVGANAEAMDFWFVVLRRVGSETDAAGEAMRTMLEALTEPGFEVSEQAAAYRELGVAVRDSAGQMRPITDIFDDVINALVRIEDPQRRASLAMKIMEEDARDVAPALGLIADQAGRTHDPVRTMRDRLAEANQTMSAEQQQKIRDFGEALSALKDAATGLGLAVGDDLLPQLTEWINWLTNTGFPRLREFWGQVEAVRQSIRGVSQEIVTLGGLLPTPPAFREKPGIAEFERRIAEQLAETPVPPIRDLPPTEVPAPTTTTPRAVSRAISEGAKEAEPKVFASLLRATRKAFDEAYAAFQPLDFMISGERFRERAAFATFDAETLSDIPGLAGRLRDAFAALSDRLASLRIEQAMAPTTDAFNKLGTQVDAANEALGRLQATGEQLSVKLDPAKMGFIDQLKIGFQELLPQIARAAQWLGQDLVGSIGRGVSGLQDFAQGLVRTLADLTSELVGGALSKALSGLGSAAGPIGGFLGGIAGGLVGRLADFLGFGDDEEEPEREVRTFKTVIREATTGIRQHDAEIERTRKAIKFLRENMDRFTGVHRELYQETLVKLEEELARLTDKTKETAEALSEMVRNIPSGFKVSRAVFGATVAGLGTPALPSTTQGLVERATGFQVNGDIHITTSGDETGEDVLRKIERAAQERESRGGGGVQFSRRVAA